MRGCCKAKAEQRPFLRSKLETDPKIILIYRHFDLQNDAKKTDGHGMLGMLRRSFLHMEDGQLIPLGVNRVDREKAQPAPSESGPVLKKSKFRCFFRKMVQKITGGAMRKCS